jgi:alginate O-acetyltransferase complex protein AlgI
VRRGDVPVSRSFIRYAAYKALFPQLIAGPIVRYAEIRADLEARRQTLAQFGAGARRFMLGFAMKVGFADTLAPLVQAAFDLQEPTLIDAWTGALAYTLQLYFDFAGYSAMAIGLALMLGFRFPENFDHPYLAGSIQNFWQRWHMTLSRFLRDYLYVPLGGNRRGPVRTYLNLLTTMAIGGFWHGANWTFLLWGIWHGGLLALHRGWRAAGHGPMPWLAGHLLTLLAVILGWVLFRAPDLAGALRMFAGMAGAHGAGLSEDLAWQVTSDQWACLGLALAAIYAPKLWPARLTLGPIGWVAAPVLAFALGVVLLYSRSAVPFLYFQF